MAIIDRINWPALDSLVEVQQRNREAHSPVISLFRWWARRPHAVAGAILDAASAEFEKDSFLVADPFSGGGTVAFEAVRRGHTVYAQDLYPWPTFALAASLTRSDAKSLAKASEELLGRLEPWHRFYRRSAGERTFEITHVIRVRVAPCPHCAGVIHLFGDGFVSLASRRVRETQAYFGCHACGAVSLRAADAKRYKCDTCGRYSTIGHSPKSRARRTVCCPHCENVVELSTVLNRTPAWKPVLVQDRGACSLTTGSAILRPVIDDDPVEDVAPTPEENALRVKIPVGVETRHLPLSGFRFWSDLYTHRQVQTLLAAIREAASLDCSESIRARLRFAVLGACEMPAYLCRWARTHPKTFEATANHRYSRSTVVTETNLLSPIGRGTIPRRLRAAVKGLLWLQQKSMPARTVLATTANNRRRHACCALVVTGSSERQLLKDGAAQLVLTDPPYHDDLQYGELARLFHTWLAIAVPVPEPAEDQEAVPNANRGIDTVRYEWIIKNCLSESRRTLATAGRLVLTFHNNELKAWAALRNAIRDSGFAIVGLATVSAENAADHSKRNKRVFLCDLVIECIPLSKARSKRGIPLTVGGRNDTKQRRNLLAVGLAMAETINRRSAEDLGELYEGHLRKMGEIEKFIR